FLLGIAVIIAFILSAWIVFELVSWSKDKNDKRIRFDHSVGQMRLTSKEKTFLLQAAMAGNLHDPSRLLRRPSEFDRWMSRFESNGNTEERKIVQELRKKLFGGASTHRGWKSTKDFEPGWRMSMRVSGHRECLVEGCLVSVDPDGLILSVNSLAYKSEKTDWLSDGITKGIMVRLSGKKKTIHVPLQPQTRMEIHLTTQDGIVLNFSTYLQSVIPGPQKMLVVDHSNIIHIRGNKRAEAAGRKMKQSPARSAV
ncbi:hypothetical protein K8I31_11980, partial [bacterium]|nr:hypothetical protein [bacterium]